MTTQLINCICLWIIKTNRNYFNKNLFQRIIPKLEWAKPASQLFYCWTEMNEFIVLINECMWSVILMNSWWYSQKGTYLLSKWWPTIVQEFLKIFCQLNNAIYTLMKVFLYKKIMQSAWFYIKIIVLLWKWKRCIIV